MQVLTSEGRIFQGTLKSFDQRLNLILSDCKEHLYRSDNEPMEMVTIGAYFIRGDNVAIVSAVDRHLKQGDVFGDPLPPMQLSWSLRKIT